MRTLLYKFKIMYIIKKEKKGDAGLDTNGSPHNIEDVTSHLTSKLKS